MVYFENTVSLSWGRLFTFNIFTDSSPYLCQNAKTLNAKLSQQVNLNHSDLSKYSMRNTFSLFFCFIIAHDYDPTVVRTIIQFRHFLAV